MSSSEATITGSDGRQLVPNRIPPWRRRKSLANYIALLPYLAFALFPFYIMFITSVKTRQELSNLGILPFRQ